MAWRLGRVCADPSERQVYLGFGVVEVHAEAQISWRSDWGDEDVVFPPQAFVDVPGV